MPKHQLISPKPEDIEDLSTLAVKMGVVLDKNAPLRIKRGENGAHAGSKSIYISESLYKTIDLMTLHGIFAHELAHIKKNHNRNRRIFMASSFILFFILSFATPIYKGSELPLFWKLTLTIGFFMLLVLNFAYMRRQEIEADDIACEYVGASEIVYAYNRLSKLINQPDHILDHPRWKTRIARQQSKIVN